jgi:hypothetical protein
MTGYVPKVGDTVEAWHPRMFGVIKTGTVDSVGTKWVWIDFGELGGGLFRVPRSHVLDRVTT